MRGVRRACWTVAIVAMVALPAGQASGAQLQTETLSASGALTYTWQGDPSRGCAAEGLCGIHGELVLHPQSGSQTVTFPSGTGSVEVLLSVTGTVRVLRQGAQGGECVDTTAEPLNVLNLRLSGNGRRLAVTLQTPAASGRCAGPLQSELSSIPIPVKRTGRSYDLRGIRSFGAGAFSGTFLSTLTLRAVRASGANGFSSSSSSGSSPASPIKFEHLQLQYRVSSVSSSILTQFNGVTDSSCQIVDSCGANGSLGFSVQPGNTLSVFGNRRVHRPVRAAQVLSDFRRGRLPLNGFATLTGHMTESYVWGNGTNCNDNAATPKLELILGAPGSAAVGKQALVTLMSSSGPGVEVFRTHCPGPADSDLLGANMTLASGKLSVADLLAKRSTLVLTEPSAFTGLGYTGSRSGSVQLELTLIKVSAGTSS